MKKALLAFCLFTAICLLSAGMAWAGGFDFDRRDPAVAFWVFCTLAAGVLPIPRIFFNV